MCIRDSFGADDHRTYNRHGEAFDVGETFSGVPFDVGLAAVRALAPAVPEGTTMAQFALRWIIDQPGGSTVIPGARSAEQALGNARAAELPALGEDRQALVREVYDGLVRRWVHERW